MMLAALDGLAWTATELAEVAGVSRPSASEHLHQLVDAGFLAEVRQGRHRYVRIEDPAVAETVEALAALSGDLRPAGASLRAQRADRELREARTCYRHLAGRLGVALCVGLREHGYVDGGWGLTEPGRDWFHSLGITLPDAGRRPLLRPCLDWTERREHLAGVAADALLETMRAKHRIEPGASRRAVRLTETGRTELAHLIFSSARPDSPAEQSTSAPQAQKAVV